MADTDNDYILVELPIEQTSDGQWRVCGDRAATEAEWRGEETIPGVAGRIARQVCSLLDIDWVGGPPNGIAHILHRTTGEEGALLRQADGQWAADWPSLNGRDPIPMPWEKLVRHGYSEITVAPENRADEGPGPREDGYVFLDFDVTHEPDGRLTAEGYETHTEAQWREASAATGFAGALATQMVWFIDVYGHPNGPECGEAWVTHRAFRDVHKLVRAGDLWLQCELDGTPRSGDDKGHTWAFWTKTMRRNLHVTLHQPDASEAPPV